MQVASFKRLGDQRLRIVVQGVGRAVVVRGTQALPFARGDVQLLPDTEALLDAACASRAWLLQAMDAANGQSASEPEATESAVELATELSALDWSSAHGSQLRRRATMAAATEEEAWWRDYEHAPYELLDGNAPPPAFCTFSASVATRTVSGAADAVLEAVREVGAAADRRHTPLEGEASDAVSSALLEAVVLTPLDEAPAEAAEEAAERVATLHALEVQVWLELDAILRGIAHLAGDPDAMPVPVQLLGLLPPPPTGGWPEDFALQRVASGLRAAQAARRAKAAGTLIIGGSASDVLGYDVEEDAAEPFDQATEGYPARRRAQRLSFSIWQVIANYWEGLELQPALEVESTSDRLRMGLIRLRALAEQLKGMSAF